MIVKKIDLLLSSETFCYRGYKLPYELRVTDLFNKMNLSEKVTQLLKHNLRDLFNHELWLFLASITILFITSFLLNLKPALFSGGPKVGLLHTFNNVISNQTQTVSMFPNIILRVSASYAIASFIGISLYSTESIIK